MSFVISANANAPVGYTSPSGHDTEAQGSLDFYHRLRRFVTGNPEIDSLSKVGTHDTELLTLDTHDNTALTTGTYSLRMNVDGVSMTLSHSTSGNLDTNVPAPAGALTSYNFDRSQVHGVAFQIDRTVDADPAAATTEGWDFVLAANGLSAADRWLAEEYALLTAVLRGRRVSGSSDPTDYFWIHLETNPVNPFVRLRGLEDADSGVGNNSGFKHTPLTLSGAIAYWIVASHRHFCWVARIAGDYHQQWAGFIDTFGTKQQYPYPLLIAADSSGSGTMASDTSQSHMAFLMNGFNSSRYRAPTGVWKDVGGAGVQSGTAFDTAGLQSGPADTEAGFWPYHCSTDTVSGLRYRNGPERTVGLGEYIGSTKLTPMRGPTSGERYALPVMVIQGESDRHALLGELASVFCTNGSGDPAPVEELFEVNSVSYIMFPNIQRQQEQNFWSLKLE